MIDKLHALLSRMVMERLFWLIKRMPVLSIYREYLSNQWDTESAYIKRRNERLALIITHAVHNIPYYTQFTKNIPLEKIKDDPIGVLNNFPALTKYLITNNMDKIFLEQGFGTYKNSTGGSTGVPLTIYQDNYFQSHSLAATYLMYEWAGRKIGAKLIKLWGAERDLDNGRLGIKQKLSDFIGNRLTINSFKMSSHDILEDYISIINTQKPITIEGYADSLYYLADFAISNNIKVFPPLSIVSSAGVLYPHMRKSIEDTFGCKIYDRYGSRDAGNIAAECDHHNGLHIFGENIFVEIVNEDGVEVEEGEEGNLLITTLHNYTMPLIRYEIGDRAIKGGICTCGRPYPLLKKISGRRGSRFKTTNGGSVSSNFFVHLIGVSCNDGDIKKFQAVQVSYDSIQIKLVVDDDFSINDWHQKEKVRDLINKAFGYECDTKFFIVDDIPQTSTGKHLYTICEI